MKEFNEFQVSVRTLEGGHIVTSSLLLDGVQVDARQQIVTGKDGSPVLASRLRKAIKSASEGAFPRPPKVDAADLPGQQVLPGTN